jgi:RNA polymerase sigma factor (sigma-70 family)
MTDFRELTDYEIDRLDDARLLAYIAAAREAGEAQTAALDGVRHLIFRHLDSVVARVRRKVPAHLVEDVAAEAMIEAIASAFGGTTIKEFHKWLNVIVQRHIADFYRGPRGRQLALDREGEVRRAVDDEGEELVAETGEEGGFAEAEVQQLIDSLMGTRSPEHRRAIDMLVWSGYSAREASEATGLGEDNCYQVVRRFRVDLRAALDGDTGGRT